MNFEDEEYVRVYTKKTITFRRLRWQGRTLLWHLMLEADRGGVVELGEGEEVEALVDLLDLPEGVVRVGLERLAALGVTSRHGTTLIIDRFVEAQEARRSDRMRAQEYRERQRSVTERHEPSREQTERHAASRFVTPPLPSPSPSPALPERDPPTPSVLPPQGGDIATADLNSFAPDPPKPKARERKPRQAQWSRFPADFEPDESHRKLAAELGLDLQQQLLEIRDHQFKSPKSDPAATLRTWLRNVPKFSPAPRSPLPFRGSRQPEVSPNVDYETRAALASSRRLQEFLAGAK